MFQILLLCCLPIFEDMVASRMATAVISVDNFAFFSNVKPIKLKTIQDEETSEQQSIEQPKVELDQPKTWPSHAPEASRMAFQMPDRPRFSERTLTPIEGQAAIRVRNYVGSYDGSRFVLVASFHDLPIVPEERELIKETLEGAMRGSILNLNGKLIESKAIRYVDNPGIEYVFRFAANEQIYRGMGRVFLVGQRQYMISAMMLEEKFDDAISEGFLGSFKLIEEIPETELGRPKLDSVDQDG